MWTRLHRAPSWRAAVATTPSLSMRRGFGHRVFSVKSADLHNTASLSAEKATQSPTDVAEPETDQDRARRSLYKISSAIRTARTPASVTTLWNILSRHEPVFVEGGFVRAISSTEAENDEEEKTIAVPTDQVLLRMVSLQEMLQLERQGQRHVVVERALPFSSEDHTVLPLTHDNKDNCVVLLSENFVARKIPPALHRLGQFEALTTFVETMSSDRRLQLQLLHADTKATEDTQAVVAELTSLGAHSDALYVASLGQLKQHAKILEYCKPHASDLGRFIVRRDAFASLLDACVKTRDGELAKIAIDQAMDKYPLLTFNTRLFTAALHANLRAKPKTLERLETAMHIYRRMFHDAGYILAPQEWSLLFNSCIYLDQSELALEIFRDYRAHGIAPFQHRFEQALRTACRFHQYDLAIEMARLWIHTEAMSPPVLTTLSSERLQQDEAECLNKILWEMLKNQPTLDQVEQVLLLMQPRDVQAGALVVRRIVTRFFDHSISDHDDQDEDGGSQLVTRFLTLWERCPQVIQRTGFVVHLMLDACSARGWHDQCERVIQYAIAEKMDLPIGSTTKIMEQYAARGEFDSAIQLGELVVQASSPSSSPSSSSSSTDRHQQNQHHDRPKSRQRLPDNFFECLLTSYLFRQRFDDAVRVGDTFRLGDRRGESNLKLAAILRDARSMAGDEFQEKKHNSTRKQQSEPKHKPATTMARLAFLTALIVPWIMMYITASATTTERYLDGRVHDDSQDSHSTQEHPFINLLHDKAVDLHHEAHSEPRWPELLPVGAAATNDVFKPIPPPTPRADEVDQHRRLNTPFDLLFQVLYVSDDDKAEVKTEKEEEEKEKKKAEQQKELEEVEEENGATESTAGSDDWLSEEYQSMEPSQLQSSRSAHSDAGDGTGSIPSGSQGTSTIVMPIPSSTSSESTTADSFKTSAPVATTAQPSLTATTAPGPPPATARVKSVAATVNDLGMSVAVAIVGTVATAVW